MQRLELSSQHVLYGFLNQVSNHIPNQGLCEIPNRKPFVWMNVYFWAPSTRGVGGFTSYGRRWMVYVFSSLEPDCHMKECWVSFHLTGAGFRILLSLVDGWSFNPRHSSRRRVFSSTHEVDVSSYWGIVDECIGIFSPLSGLYMSSYPYGWIQPLIHVEDPRTTFRAMSGENRYLLV